MPMWEMVHLWCYHHHPFQLGLISSLGSYDVSKDLGRMVSYVVPDEVLYVYLSSWRIDWDSVKKIK